MPSDEQPDEQSKKWGTIFMGSREATVAQLDAMQGPIRREQMRQKMQETYMDRVRDKATDRARQILGEAYAERQKVLEEADAEGKRQIAVITADAEKIRKAARDGYAAMQAELERAAQIRADAEQIRAEVMRMRENAYADGHEQGETLAAEEMRQFREDMGNRLSHVLRAVSAQFAAVTAQWREDLVDLVRTAVSVATGHVMDSMHEQAVRALMLDALGMLENRATVTIRVHPDDEKIVGALFKAARERAPELQNWVVNGEDGMEPGGFVVETWSGSVDARRAAFREMLEGLMKHLSLPETDLDREVAEAAEDVARREIAVLGGLASEPPATPVEDGGAPVVPAAADAAGAMPPPDGMPSAAGPAGGVDEFPADAALDGAAGMDGMDGMAGIPGDPAGADGGMFIPAAENASLAGAADPAGAMPGAPMDLPADAPGDLPAEELPEPQGAPTELAVLEDELFAEDPSAIPGPPPEPLPPPPDLPPDVLEKGGFL